jgi:hypothetical protein
VVQTNGKAATGIEVPDDVVAGLGAGKRPPVHVTIGDHTYRSTVAVMGGRFMLPLSAENRGLAGVGAGDEVAVTVVLDTEPRVVTVPPDLATALDAEPEARRRFGAMSYSHQLQHVLAVNGAKTDATRARRIAKAVEQLRDDH